MRVNALYRGESRWQVRDISGGDGESNQQSLNAEFGLADATNVDTVRIEWPSGTLQELRDVAPRQFLTVTEPLCSGDCSSDGQVSIDELLTLVNVALGSAQRSACPHGVPSSAAVDIAVIIQAVNHALNGCGGG